MHGETLKLYTPTLPSPSYDYIPSACSVLASPNEQRASN